NYRRQTFHFSEKYRGTVLLQKMMDTAAKNTANLPTNLLQKEQKLQQELAQLNAQIQKTQAEGVELNTVQISQWQAQYFDKQQAYEQLMGHIEAEHPDYFQLKYNPQTATIADLQKTLSPKTALVSYSIAPNFHHVFVVTQNDFHSLELPTISNLSEKIQEFKEWMQAGIVDLFTQTSTELYQILLQPIEVHLSHSKHLILIPDDSLHYLPFECLLTPQNEDVSSESENDSFSSLPYLIQSYKISYHHSATLFHYHYQKQASQNKQTNKALPNSFFGLAPVSFNAKSQINKEMGYIAKSAGIPSNNYTTSKAQKLTIPNPHRCTKILKSSTSQSAALADLKETETEVKTVFQLFADKGFEATALFYNQATKENLQKYLKGHKYVLLSTHGFVDEKNPAHSGLFLYQTPNPNPNIYQESPISSENPNIHQETKASTKNQQHPPSIQETSILHTSEAYLLELDADLVVLSSCESGIGRLQKGEGMLALNRAFMQAGASNIIYSLFKIPQDTTSELTQHLFQHILEGDNYATALQKAKLALIEQDEIEPRDWAGLVLLGK
ncbi:MAG: CHAT domain-containing protein, partial [Chitinophagales bacterium]